MRKFLTVLNGIGYGFLVITGLTYIGNKILDLNNEEPPEEPDIRHTKKTTVYPDGMYPDCTTEDFNKWSEHIHRQLN